MNQLQLNSQPNRPRRSLSLDSILRGALTTILAALPLASALPSLAAAPPAGPAAAQPRLPENYGKIPLSFEPNQGQADARVQFQSRGTGYALYLTPGEVVLSLEKQAGVSNSLAQDPNSEGQRLPASLIDTLRMRLVGANAAAAVSGADPKPGVVNYLVGSDQKNWHSGIHTFGKVNYTQIYPGVDLVFYGNQRQLEYDFVVAPGADASQIAWQIDGATATVDKDGNLVLTAAHGPASFKAPVIYQMDGAKRVAVDGAFQVAGNRIHFKLGSYDHAKPLVIDPVLVYSTYLGGAGNESSSTDGESQIGWNLNFSASGFSSPTQGLAVDSEGDVYVTGYTNSTNFPLQNPLQSAVPGPDADYRSFAVFVTKFNAQGTGLIYSTYLGGIGAGTQSVGAAIAVDSSGNAYVGGFTDDGTFPVTAGAFQTLCAADSNGSGRINGCGFEAAQSGFVSKLDPTGQTLIYSTFLGGQIYAEILAIAVDAQGRTYVTGNSSDYCSPTQPAYYCFPTTANAILPGTASYAYQPSLGYPGLYTGNAFVSVFDAAGANLLYSSYIGDNTALITNGTRPAGYWGPTNGNAVTVDSQGDFFVTGDTLAPDLPITPGALQSAPSWLPGICCQAFVAKFAPLSSSGALDYLTYFGGPGDDYGTFATSLAADSQGELYIAGLSHDQDFPTTPGAFQTTCGFVGDQQCGIAFVTKLNTAGNGLVWSTMLGNERGGSGSTVATVGPIQLDSAGNVYIIGTTSGYYPDFPQVNPIQAVTGGNELPFITEFDPTGSKVLFSTFFGSAGQIGEQYAAGLAVDAGGNIYMAGNAYTTGVQTTAGAFQTSFLGTYDGYIAKISPLVPSSIALSASPNPAAVGQQVTLTATVTGSVASPIPTGTVTFYSGGSELGTGTVGPTGTASYKTSFAAVNTYSLTAVYGGDATFSASTSPAQPLNVTIGSQSITFTGLPATATYGSAGPYALNGSASSGLAVSYGVSGPASVSGSTLTITGAGTVVVTASQRGNASYSAATPVSLTIQVGKAGQTISFNAIAAQNVGASVPLTATASSGLAVSFTSLTTAVCTISGSTAAMIGPGTCTIQAMQSGNANYAAATAVSQSLSVAAASGASFTITPIPAVETITRGDLGIFILELRSVKGFNGLVKLTCSGGPVGDECVDFPQTVKVTGTALAFSGILFHPQAKPGTYTITFTGVSGSITEKVTAQFIVK